MKLKKLTIHNITSIEDAVIDFEHGPLANDSLFLITGITGSGKSSILDSICLALYCTTPRIKECKSEKYVDDKETFNTRQNGGATVDSTDVRMYIRRGAKDAFVELVFTDKDDCVLTSRWSCAKSQRAPYRVMDYTIELWNDKGDLLTDKKREFCDMIVDRLGMTFEQFCRTTMLAQGEFTKFLKSTVDEKSAILEKVTGTEIYTQIGAQISQIYSEKKRAYADLELQLGTIRLLTDEEKTTINEEIRRLQQSASAMSAEKSRLMEQHRWLEARSEAERKLSDYSVRQSELQCIEQSENFVKERQLLEDWDKCMVRESWLRKKALTAELFNLEKADAELKQRYENFLRGIFGEERKHSELCSNHDACNAYIEERSEQAAMFRQADTILLLLGQTDDAHRQIAGNQQRLESVKANIGEQEKKIGTLNAEREKLQQSDAKNRKALQQAQDELRQFDLKELQTERTRQQRSINALTEFESVYKKYRQAMELMAKADEEYRTACESVQVCERQQKELQEQYTAAEKDFHNVEQTFEKQKMSCDDVLKNIRSRLVVGDTCPLCGQKVEVMHRDEAFESVLAPMKKLLETKREQFDKAYRAYSDKSAEVTMGRRDITRCEKNKSLAEKELQTATQNYRENVAGESYCDADNIEERIKEDIQLMEQQLSELDEKIMQVGVCQEKVSVCSKCCETSLSRLTDADREIGEAQEQLSKYRTQAEGFKAGISTHEETISQNMVRLAEMITLPHWQEMYAHSSEEFRADIRRQADAYTAQQEKLSTLTEQIRNHEHRLEELRSRVGNICEKKPSWADVNTQDEVAFHNIESVGRQLYDAVTNHVSNVVAKQKELEKEEAQIHAYLQQEDAVSEERIAQLAEQSVETVNAVRAAHNEYREKCTALSANIETVKKELVALEEHMPQFEEGLNDIESLTLRMDSLEQEQAETARKIGGEQNKLSKDAEDGSHYRVVEQQLTAARSVRDKWSVLNSMFGAGEGKYFRIIAQSYILKELIRNANRYLSTLTSRYELVCQSGALIILLKDNDAGGIVRPVTTISGGESFLVSLSLALGLSALGSSNVSMDILFIDEGFGTLDGTYLNTVMDTLEKLHHMGGRKVGIISHVESLKERLSTQIRLVRENTTKSRVEVVSTIGGE